MSFIYSDWQQKAFPQVDYWADLPAVGPSIGLVYIVRNSSGIWPINYHPSGWYRSDGFNWTKFDDIQEILDGQTLTDIDGPLVGSGGVVTELTGDLNISPSNVIANAHISTSNGTIHYTGDQITSIDLDGMTVTLSYDVFGKLISSFDGTRTKTILYSGDTPIGWTVT